MDPDLINQIVDIGFAGGLLLILIGGSRGWWIYGKLHDRIVADLVADRDLWRKLALGTLRIAERAADAVDATDE